MARLEGPAHRSAPWILPAALLAVAAGAFLAVQGAASRPVQVIVGVVVAEVGLIALVGVLLGLLERLSARRAVTTFVLRDAARHRVRVLPAVAASLAMVALASAAMVYQQSQHAQEVGRYVASAPIGSALVLTDDGHVGRARGARGPGGAGGHPRTRRRCVPRSGRTGRPWSWSTVRSRAGPCCPAWDLSSVTPRSPRRWVCPRRPAPTWPRDASSWLTPARSTDGMVRLGLLGSASERMNESALPSDTATYVVLVGGGVLAVLLVTWVVTALAAQEARAELETLEVLGAPPGTRRRIVAAQAGLVAVAGTWCGVPAGLALGVLAVQFQASQVIAGGRPAPPLVVPWALVPVLAGRPADRRRAGLAR